MNCRIAEALKLVYKPVAILWSDEKPAGAKCFVEGKWGCVMGMFASVAEKGKTVAFDRQTYGCWGGGVGLGFGNAYKQFPGGEACFCRFLSSGNARSGDGQAVAGTCAAWMRGEFRENFLNGEGYLKTPERVEQFVRNLPIIDVPSRYVIFKPLEDLSEGETPVAVVMLPDPDQLSALVVLANYDRPNTENVIIPYAAGCQTIGIFAYREARRDPQRAVVGLTDLSARRYMRRLGRDLMTFTVPFAMFKEMEGNVEGSFLQKETWQHLLKDRETVATE
jgi:uncharacterized protein (DUF169 family)